MSENVAPRNDVKNVGFFEGQLLANGATSNQCGEISAALLKGEQPPKTGDERVDRVAQNLTKTSLFGSGMNA